VSRPDINLSSRPKGEIFKDIVIIKISRFARNDVYATYFWDTTLLSIHKIIPLDLQGSQIWNSLINMRTQALSFSNLILDT
jgi:hypothetical protein